MPQIENREQDLELDDRQESFQPIPRPLPPPPAPPPPAPPRQRVDRLAAARALKYDAATVRTAPDRQFWEMGRDETIKRIDGGDEPDDLARSDASEPQRVCRACWQKGRDAVLRAIVR
jgi:hypothetical protein